MLISIIPLYGHREFDAFELAVEEDFIPATMEEVL